MPILLFPSVDSLPGDRNSMFLLYEFLSLKQRKPFCVAQDCAHDDTWFITHPFKAIRIDKGRTTGITTIELFSP